MAKGGGGRDSGSGNEGFSMWKNCQPWNLSVRDYDEMGLVKKPALPLPSPSRSNNPLAVVMGSTDPLPKAAVAEARQSKKRGRGEGCSRDGNGKESGGEVKERKTCESDPGHRHRLTERVRRKKLRNMFEELHTLLPKLPPKKGQQGLAISSSEAPLSSSTAFSSSISKNPSIREAFLGAGKGSSSNSGVAVEATNIVNSSVNVSVSPDPMAFQTWGSGNVVLNVCGHGAQLSVCSQNKSGVFSTICYVLEKHNIELVTAHLSANTRRMYMIQTKVNRASDQSTTEAIAQVEEIYICKLQWSWRL
ncbi:hypothetical protein LWI28_006444 [Acer negundo]|uniref:ACT domain-containing protein n=1 Tax=Acer negundo TaxID=4023 RepID=A0AAD5IXU9_ACENE|nr:hypothetical protein LWI28_006444 [Acer negundo]